MTILAKLLRLGFAFFERFFGNIYVTFELLNANFLYNVYELSYIFWLAFAVTVMVGGYSTIIQRPIVVLHRTVYNWRSISEVTTAPSK
jgi:hypothetical protein